MSRLKRRSWFEAGDGTLSRQLEAKQTGEPRQHEREVKAIRQEGGPQSPFAVPVSIAIPFAGEGMVQPATCEVLMQGRVNALADWDALIGRSYEGTRLESAQPVCRARLDRLRLGDVQAARIVAEPHAVWRWRDCSPDQPLKVTYLLLQERGTSVMRQSGRTVVLDEGMGALCDPNNHYQVEFPEAYSAYLVEIPNRLLPNDGQEIVLAGTLMPPRLKLVHGVLGQIFQQSPYLCQQSEWAEGVYEALTSLLRHLAPSGSLIETTPNRARRAQKRASITMRGAVLQIIDQRLTDPDLTVGAVATALNVSRRSVQRVFADLHCNASAFIIERRLRLAAHQLATSAPSETITAIAMACGFSDSGHFARCFRARFGVPPSVFRRDLGPAGFLSDLS